MRLFYEAWIMLDANSSVTTDELQIAENQIDIYHAIQIPNIAEFPIEDFFKVPFTHHSRIVAGVKTAEARCYYIHRTAEEHLSVDGLKKLIKQDAYGHREQMPSNFSKAITNAETMRKAVTNVCSSKMAD